MITRRRFVKGVVASTISASSIKIPLSLALATDDFFTSRYIPGWTRQVTCDWTEQAFSFSDLFHNGYLTRHRDYPYGTFFNVVHHNLYESPQTVKELNDDTHLFVISGHLESIDNIDRIFLFDEHIQKSELSLACLTIPSSSGGIQSVLNERKFAKLFENLPCSIVLVDTQEIEASSPVLPLATPFGSNKDRILQTVIYGIIEPVVTVGMVSVDIADLKIMLRENKLIGAGLFFINMSDDLKIAREEAINVICSQITQNVPRINSMNFCWANVCGGRELSMDYYEATANILNDYGHDDALWGVSLTVDSGLKDYVMSTYYIGLA